MTTPDVLVVCAANVARSPLFAALLQTEADARLGPDVVRVGSAGVQARTGQPAAPGSIIVARRRAGSLDGHRAQHVATVSLQSVSLVLTMAQEHNDQLLAGRTYLGARTFLLRELVTILETREVRAGLDGLPSGMRERLAAIADLADGHRPKRRLKRKWDVPDPIRSEIQVYETLGIEFARSASIVADAVFGSAVARRASAERPSLDWFP